MSTTYAVADLHGRHDLLEAAIEAIEADAVEAGTIVFLGDYVDRGPQSSKVIERLMAGPSGGWHWVCLKGNHEEMMVECLRGSKPIDWWIGNGGGQTLESYGHPRGAEPDVSVVPSSHVAWADFLPLMHIDEHRAFVHAGVDPFVPLDLQDARVLLWKRYRPQEDRGHGALFVVHGHDPSESGPIIFERRVALDTLAWLTGRLTVAVFEDDMPGGPTRFLEVNREPA